MISSFDTEKLIEQTPNMTKSISCSDAGKDCKWSASAGTEEELMMQVTEHVLAEPK